MAWTPDGKVVYHTREPILRCLTTRLVTIDLAYKAKDRKYRLAQASEAPAMTATGNTVYFVRPADHRNVTKRYQGGTARQVWKFTQGSRRSCQVDQRPPVGGSHHPMWFSEGRVYFIYRSGWH